MFCLELPRKVWRGSVIIILETSILQNDGLNLPEPQLDVLGAVRAEDTIQGLMVFRNFYIAPELFP